MNKVPFPNHTNYKGSYIKPNNFSQTELDNHTNTFFKEWKATYLKNDCKFNEYNIYSGNDVKIVSEAQGYGMIIMCLMANLENDTKPYFDGLFKYYKSHPSKINSFLMDWQQLYCDENPNLDDDSASDGDIDIAYSLLMADKQWGSNGNINYLKEAKLIINAIMQDEINANTFTVKLGDWGDLNNLNYYYGTRSSDFITDHFKSFAVATGNTNWNLVVDKCYTIINNIQNINTGLIPDFIVDTNTIPKPASANYLESIYDGDYYYNACRFPWRIGTDYLISGDNRAKTAVNKINLWLINASESNVQNISNGYQLNGTKIYNWNDATFIGPFTVSAMMNLTNQNWINDLYSELINNNDLQSGDYYSNTIKLLSLITISGNYWNPNI
jgi:endo-1,4-beta-D-glucanase Y